MCYELRQRSDTDTGADGNAGSHADAGSDSGSDTDALQKTPLPVELPQA